MWFRRNRPYGVEHAVWKTLSPEQKRALIAARAARRREQNLKPDLRGMTKQKRRLGYEIKRWWGQCLIRRRERPDKPEKEVRELKPRPPYVRNRKAYHRPTEKRYEAAQARP